jgi:hypothetical protein
MEKYYSLDREVRYNAILGSNSSSLFLCVCSQYSAFYKNINYHSLDTDCL